MSYSTYPGDVAPSRPIYHATGHWKERFPVKTDIRGFFKWFYGDLGVVRAAARDGDRNRSRPRRRRKNESAVDRGAESVGSGKDGAAKPVDRSHSVQGAREHER